MVEEDGEHSQKRNDGRNSTKKEFHSILEKARNLFKPNEARPCTSSPRQTQPEDDRSGLVAPEPVETENMSSDSENTIAVPIASTI